MIYSRFALRQRYAAASAAFAVFAGLTAFAGFSAPPAFSQTPASDALLPQLRLAPQNLVPSNVTAAAAESGGLTLTFSPADYPGVVWNAGRAYDSKDWSGSGGMVWTLHNPNADPLTVLVRVDDDPSADGQNHCRTGNATLAPGETATLVFPFSATSPGMNVGPPLVPSAENARFFTIYGSDLNPKNIVAFQIFLSQPKTKQTLELQSVRLAPKPSLVGIVDEFGQYAKADWPGKLKSADEAAKRVAEEKTWLAAHPPLQDRDDYGGWKTGPLLKTSGFFRTALMQNGKEIPAPKPGLSIPVGSRWWLVDPSGHLFWSAGVDCVRPYAEGKIDGREAMFTVLTDDWKKRGQTDFYFANMQRKYGENWQTEWINSDVARLKAMGFNTAGNWSDESLFRAKRVPYTVSLSAGGLPPLAANGNGFGLPDYFDPKFPEQSRAALLAQTKEWKNDAWCLGYFVDNELAWDTWAQFGTGGDYVAAREAIAAPPSLAARGAFVKILQAKYKTPADWGKAWNVSVTDWDTPVKITKDALNSESKADCAAFSTALATRYFSITRAALKEAAPNQLYLGCRFAIRPPEMVAVAGKYCDVVSFNIYADTVDPKEWAFTASLGKPVIIGEYHFGATDRGMFSPGLRARANQNKRAEAFAAYVQSARALPAFVGCHWFQWLDEPLTGRFDGENHAIGFVSVTDTPYPEMREAARRVNATLYAPPK